jgi:hypothetical protein
MNGIIHVCSRAIATSGAPYTEAEMFLSIFAYVQALVEKVRPKKVLFLAVDGKQVAVCLFSQVWHPEPKSINSVLDVLDPPRRRRLKPKRLLKSTKRAVLPRFLKPIRNGSIAIA